MRFWHKSAENFHLSHQLQLSGREPRSMDILCCGRSVHLHLLRKYVFQKVCLCYKLQPKFIKLLLNYFLMVLTIPPLEFSKFWNYNDFFFVFVNMGPNGSDDFKTLFLLQITVESFQTFPEFSFYWFSPNWDYWNFVCSICNVSSSKF